MRHGSDRESYVFRNRRAVRIHFHLLEFLKCDLGDFKKAMFQDVVWSYELIFYLMVGPKRDLGDVEKATFHSDELPATSFSAFWADVNATWALSTKR